MPNHNTTQSSRMTLVFSCVGHTYAHLFAPTFFVVALTLENELGMTHGEVISLIVLGNMLYGLAAPLSGWLGDKWSAAGMMALYYFGLGAGMILTGLATSNVQMVIFLSLTGIFGSIYHPVGFAWLVSQVEKRGQALGINGVFGSIGPSIAALSAGVLTDLISWRAAFIVPGMLIAATGVVFLFFLKKGIVHDRETVPVVHHQASRGEVMRVIAVLAVTMLCTGLIYQSTSPALPKIFSERLVDFAGGGVFGIGAMVALVYIAAGSVQIIAGRMCDRYPLKRVYLLAFIVQIPFLILAAQFGGGLLLFAALVMVSSNQAALPVENTLVARYAPKDRRALVFGLKFIIAFGFSGLGVWLEGAIYDATGGLHWLFMILAALATVGFAVSWLLPDDPVKQSEQVQPLPAE
ncbi:MAG: MFS transporter [Rhodospirillales bacterium]|nr:MFS transporter [Rhodospirillales bacterium]